MFYFFGVLCLALCGIGYSYQCYPGCKYNSCNENGTCSNGCKSGYSGPYCTWCGSGYYNNKGLCCPNNCAACSSASECSECKGGWYGKTCSKTCTSNCNTRKCHIENGSCCDEGYGGPLCSLVCPATCNTPNCQINDSSCTCKEGYTGAMCNQCSYEWYITNGQCQKCPDNCKQCSSYTMCLKCKYGWYGHTCDTCEQKHECVRCSSGSYGKNGQCKQCPDHCNGCSSHKSCYSCAAGYYGDTCQSNCSRGCQRATHACDISNGECSNGCIDGLWGNYCNKDCPSSCTSCTSNIACDYCVDGYYGTACQLNCSRGCSGQCEKQTGDCPICKTRYSGSKCDRICLQNCAACYIDGTCTVCKHGFHGPSCNLSCKVNCKTCTGLYSCEKCKDGFYGTDCSKKCPSNCVACNSATECTVCKDGFTSSKCDLKCSTRCQSCWITDIRICKKCNRGRYGTDWYNDSSTCYSECSRHCWPDVCDERSGRCNSGCVNGYSGDNCTCPENCPNACYVSDSSCHKCNDSFSGYTCSCINDTVRCSNLVCASCINNTWYKTDSGCCKCSGTCKHNQCINKNTCSHGCIDGYYGAECNDRCSLRDLSCMTCTSEGCSQCVLGFYPSKSSRKCIRCSEQCINENCSATNGSCLEGCQNGFWGIRCDVPCDAYCKVCDRRTGVCHSCANERFTRNCSRLCNKNCFRTDSSEVTCNIDNGQCELGCINNMLHGQFCELRCSSTCREKTCNWKTEKCSYGCIRTHFGERCEHKCSDTCSENVGHRNCKEVNGSCNFGCNQGYFNSRCDKECSSHCDNGTCIQSNGTCTFGCKSGFEGHNCTQALKISDSSSTLSTGAIVGIVVGVGVLILIIVLGVCFIRQRRGRKRGKPGEIGDETGQEMDNLLPKDNSSDSKEPAKFSKPLEDLTLEEKDTMTLECELTKPGVPIKWLKNGKEIKPSDHIKFSMDQQLHQLVIAEVTLEDKGKYSCVCGDVRTECTIKVEGLKTILINHYRKHCLRVDQFPTENNDIGLEFIYVNPEIRILRQSKDRDFLSKNVKDNDTSFSCRKIFKNDEYLSRQIYITGDAGIGKSVLCKHIVRLWCEAHDKSVSNEVLDSDSDYDEEPSNCYSLEQRQEERKREEEDRQILRWFEFLFYITLVRDSPQSNVTEMIQSQILEHYKDKIVKYQCSSELLKNEEICCLVIIDGLDEWKCPEGGSGLPGRDLANENNVFLTTTRPWKFEILQLKGCDVDKHIELCGFNEKSASLFCSRAFKELNKSRDPILSKSKFVRTLIEKNLGDFKAIPVILTQLIYLWFDGQELSRSQVQLYCGMLDFLLKKSKKNMPEPEQTTKHTSVTSENLPECFDKHRACQDHKQLIICSSTIAFEALVDTTENSLVFNSSQPDVYGVGHDLIKLCSNAGILSQKKVLEKLSSEKKISFLHKKEFLAAIFIVSFRKEHDIVNIVQRITDFCSTLDTCLKMSQVLLFVSGINPDISNQLLNHFTHIVTDDDKVKHYRHTLDGERLIRNIQTSVTDCVIEGRINGHNYKSIMLQDFYITETTACHVERLLSSKVKSVYIETDGIDDSQLTRITDQLEHCHSVQKLNLSGVDPSRIDISTVARIVNNNIDTLTCLQLTSDVTATSELVRDCIICSSNCLMALRLFYVKMKHEHIEQILTMLPKSPTITQLKLFLICTDHDYPPCSRTARIDMSTMKHIQILVLCNMSVDNLQSVAHCVERVALLGVILPVTTLCEFASILSQARREVTVDLLYVEIIQDGESHVDVDTNLRSWDGLEELDCMYDGRNNTWNISFTTSSQ